MKVRFVPLASPHDHMKGLPPELMASVGARYSRSNDGLDAILAKIDWSDLDASIDRIFAHIDYGHRSIADMSHCAVFMDQISIWLIYYCFWISQTASGQESSTRYVNFAGNCDSPYVPADATADMNRSLQLYTEALDIWQKWATDHPEVLRLPQALIESTERRDQQKVERIRRNYAFDRARVFLPVAMKSNFVLMQPATGWVRLMQALDALDMPEARELYTMLHLQLGRVISRVMKYTVAGEDAKGATTQDFLDAQEAALSGYLDLPAMTLDAKWHADAPAPSVPHLRTDNIGTTSLRTRKHRYSPFGQKAKLAQVAFGWDAVGLAEVRDLNRHRTGHRTNYAIPVGFYGATDQIPKQAEGGDLEHKLREMVAEGRDIAYLAREALLRGERDYVYRLTLGTQVPFCHVTTADHFIYEIELRTGLGSHYRYAEHLRDAAELLIQANPDLKGLVTVGTAEPE